MKKAISFIFTLLLIISLLANSLFSVSANYEGDIYYVPSESVFAYQFFQGYGLGFNKRVVNIGASTNATSSYNMTENQYTIVLPTQYLESGVAGITNKSVTAQNPVNYFVNGNNTMQDLGFYIPGHNETVQSHTISVPSYTITEQNHTYQILSYGALFGNFDRVTAYDSNKRINIQSGQTYVISYLSNVGSSGLSIFQSSGRNDISYTRTYSTMRYNGNDYYKMNYFVTNNSGSRDFISIDFQLTSYTDVEIISLYFGLDNMMTDSRKQELGILTTTETKLISIDDNLENLYALMLNGTTQTQQAVNNNNNSNTNLNNSTSDYHDLETNQFDNVDNTLDSIGTTNDLYNNNGFIAATNFIRTQFTELITLDSSRSLELLIVFSLILGIALTVIGKLRN